MKFFLDMPLSQRTARWLKEHGYDVIHARERGLARAPDEEILKSAAQEERMLLTMDLDIPAILALTHAHRPSVILFRMRDSRPLLIHERLELLFKSHPEVFQRPSLTVIEDFRIRIRALPID